MKTNEALSTSFFSFVDEATRLVERATGKLASRARRDARDVERASRTLRSLLGELGVELRGAGSRVARAFRDLLRGARA